MICQPTKLPGVLLIQPRVFQDERGFFLETYQREKYEQHGIAVEFVQDNHSRSVKHTLRGLHAQRLRPQAKLIRVIEGAIFDVAVDIRRNSPTFGQWFGATLSAENFQQIYIPTGFAHGFYVLSETAQVEYKCSDYYDPQGELTLSWNDPAIGIEWPFVDQNTSPLLSAKDQQGKLLAELHDSLPSV